MIKPTRGATFAELFKKYRLRSEIETLSEFGDLLAEEGIVYETSLFTRWQSGDRIPKDRKTLLAIITIFAKQKGIDSIQEANKLMESAHARDLDTNERAEIQEFFANTKNITLPDNPQIFVGRSNLIKDISWHLINQKNVWIYGLPGVGKTLLALRTAHLVTGFFDQGIFWCRADIKDPTVILDELLNYLGYSTQGIGNTELKFKKLAELVKGKKILLVLDNIGLQDLQSNEIKHFFSLPMTVLCTSLESNSANTIHKIKIESFSKVEFIALAKQILGNPFVNLHIQDIEKLGELVGYLPIASTILLKRIYVNPSHLQMYLNQKHPDLSNIPYDNKNLYSAFEFCFNNLSLELKKLLVACALFDGTDFSVELLVKLTSSTKLNTNHQLAELLKLSFLELSVKERYRLHPAIKNLLMKKLKDDQYIQLAQLYIEKLKTYSVGGKKYIQYLSYEFENIEALLKKCYDVKEYGLVTELWTLISKYLFYGGKWHLMLKYDEMIQNAYEVQNDYRGLLGYKVEYIGGIYFFQNNLKKVYKLLSDSSKIATEKNDTLILVLIKQKYGIVYTQLGEFKKAEKYLLEAIQGLKKEKKKDEFYKSYAYLSLLYSKMGKYEFAVKYGRIAIKGSYIINDETIKGQALFYLAWSYTYLNKKKLAEKYFLNAYKVMRKWQVKMGEGQALLGLGQIYMNRKDYYRGVKYLQLAANIFKELDMKREELVIKRQLMQYENTRDEASVKKNGI